MALVIRVVLGIFLIVMGINKFVPFIPAMELAEPAMSFMSALAATGYMIPLIGVVEIVAGGLLLFSVTAPFGVLLLAPHSVNIVLFHIFLDPSTGLFAALVFLGNLGLGIYYFDFYRPIFARILDERVEIKDKHPEAQAGPTIVATVN